MRTNEAIGWIGILILSVILQMAVLDQIRLSGYINPQIVPGVLVMCKTLFNRYAHLILSFLTGLVIDVWYGTGGLYASALSLISFVPFQNLLGMTLLKEYKSIRLETVDTGRFLLYLSTSYIVFFLWLFLLDNFGFRSFFTILTKVLYSSMVSIVMVFLFDVISSDRFSSKKVR